MFDNKFTRTLGDHFIYRINVDFINKETKLIFGGHPEVDLKEKYELIFSEIKCQDFDDFDFQNIFTAMEIKDSFSHFMEVKQDYIEKMKNYFPSGLLKSIKEDKTLKYYYLHPTAGLGGFVICKQADIRNLE